MQEDDPEARARVLISQAADGVHYAAHPGDEIGRSSADAPVLDPVVRELNEVENLLAPGIGRANTDEGLPKLRAVISHMESLLMSQPGQGVVFLSTQGREALGHAISLLQQVDPTPRKNVTALAGMSWESQAVVTSAVSLPQEAEAVAEKLADAAFTLQWLRLSEGGAWMLRVFDETEACVDMSVNDDPQDALLAVAERLLP
jgi:hypothetical protein